MKNYILKVRETSRDHYSLDKYSIKNWKDVFDKTISSWYAFYDTSEKELQKLVDEKSKLWIQEDSIFEEIKRDLKSQNGFDNFWLNDQELDSLLEWWLDLETGDPSWDNLLIQVKQDSNFYIELFDIKEDVRRLNKWVWFHKSFLSYNSMKNYAYNYKLVDCWKYVKTKLWIIFEWVMLDWILKIEEKINNSGYISWMEKINFEEDYKSFLKKELIWWELYIEKLEDDVFTWYKEIDIKNLLQNWRRSSIFIFNKWERYSKDDLLDKTDYRNFIVLWEELVFLNF